MNWLLRDKRHTEVKIFALCRGISDSIRWIAVIPLPKLFVFVSRVPEFIADT